MNQLTCIASCDSVELSQHKSLNGEDRVMQVNSCESIEELPAYLAKLKDKSGVLLNGDYKCLLDSLLKRHINTFSKKKDYLGMLLNIRLIPVMLTQLNDNQDTYL